MRGEDPSHSKSNRDEHPFIKEIKEMSGKELLQFWESSRILRDRNHYYFLSTGISLKSEADAKERAIWRAVRCFKSTLSSKMESFKPKTVPKWLKVERT